MSDNKQKFLNKNFAILIYLFSLICTLMTLYYARTYGLLPRPIPGMDQLTMLETAEELLEGKVSGAGYMYSYLYTFFLYILNLLSQGNLVAMRALQAAVCAFIPVFTYKLCIHLRFGRVSSQLAALLYCFYGPAMLISLSFLRAGPLALCFVLCANYFVLAFIKKKNTLYFTAGIFMAACILLRENFIPVAAAPVMMMLYPTIRKHVKKSHILYYVIGITALLLPVIIYNTAMFGSVSLIPGHWQNVMGAYHSGADGETGKTTTSILSNMPVQAINYLCSYEIPNSLSFYSHREIIEFLNVFIIPFNLFTAISLSILCVRFRNKALIFGGLLIAAYTASMLPFTMFYRFRIPTIPLLCCLSGAAIIMIIKDFSLKKYTRASISIVLLLGLFIATMQDSYALRSVSEKRGAVVLLIRKKRYNDAVRLIEKMPVNDKTAIRLKVHLLKSLDANGEKERAENIHREWIKRHKEHLKSSTSSQVK